MYKNYIGIDPGIYGAISFYNEETGQISSNDMPVIPAKDNKRQIDILRLNILFNIEESVFCVIEQVTAMPGQNSVGTLQMGFGNGIIQTILTLHRIPYAIVHPKTWMKSFAIQSPSKIDIPSAGARKKIIKQNIYSVASKLFPDIELVTKGGRLLDGRSDSLLIMEYGRRLNNAQTV